MYTPADVARERLDKFALGGYTGASKSRRSLSEWKVNAGDADDDILPDLITLRDRSRDLQRNNALAAAAISTKVTNVVGAGFSLLPEPDAEYLGLDDAAFDSLTDQIIREWELFGTRECDLERVCTFKKLTDLVYRSVKESGDVLVLLPFVERPGSPYGLKLQLIEADRICNPDYKADTQFLSGGVERDPQTGAVVAYHVADRHPGGAIRTGGIRSWTRVKAWGDDGMPNALHIMDKRRIGQTRGVPDLAGVIDALKLCGSYIDSELLATVVASKFTVFITSDTGSGFAPMEPTSETGAKSSDDTVRLGNAAVVPLRNGEDVKIADPKRPNDSFEAFIYAMLKLIAAGLELPLEVVLKHYTTSYTAARAAMLDVWRFCLRERAWLVTDFTQPVYELLFLEAVARRRITAPGFLRGDLSVRRAYTRATWVGPARGQIQEKGEMDGVEKRLELSITTFEEETAAITGTSWRRKRRARELERRLGAPSVAAKQPAMPAAPAPDPDGGSDNEEEAA